MKGLNSFEVVLDIRGNRGRGELTRTLVVAVKPQLLDIVYFWKFDTKFSFKSIELVE
jgi:hypothetical protein